MSHVALHHGILLKCLSLSWISHFIVKIIDFFNQCYNDTDIDHVPDLAVCYKLSFNFENKEIIFTLMKFSASLTNRTFYIQESLLRAD